MNDLYKGILTLVQSALTGEKLLLPAGFSFEEAYPLIKSHQIVGLAYEGAVNCGIPKALSKMRELFQLYCQGLMHSQKQLRAIDPLFAAFEEQGIDYMPVKGCNLKKLYPKPEMRVMGDADVLIRVEQYEKIKPIMERLNYVDEQFFEGVHVWGNPALEVELHEYLMPDGNVDYHRYFANSWHRAVHQSGTHYALSPEDEFVFLFVHYAKHYRGGGIGIRQPIDLWIWQQTFQLDMVYVRQELDTLGLSAFFENTQQMLQFWFGNTTGSDKAQFMTDFIFNSGSWGKQENRHAAAGIRQEQIAGSRRIGRLKMYCSAIFPSASVLKKRYPVLAKAPWLLPIMWPVRWISALLFRRKNVRAFQSTVENTTSDKLDAFQESLDYVGLGFDF